MVTALKLLAKMRQNQHDCRIKQLEVIAKYYEINIRQPRGSHVVFDHPQWVELLCVPAHRPIKPIYIKKFLSLIDFLGVPHE
jgi:predicted RNA binding protein YcfA (HicA-like mRNA interferase family)